MLAYVLIGICHAVITVVLAFVGQRPKINKAASVVRLDD